MIVLPWFVRFGLDCTVALTPAIYLHYHPTTFFFEYFQNRRRIVRRKSRSVSTQLTTTSSTSTQSPPSPRNSPRKYSRNSKWSTDPSLS